MGEGIGCGSALPSTWLALPQSSVRTKDDSLQSASTHMSGNDQTTDKDRKQNAA